MRTGSVASATEHLVRKVIAVTRSPAHFRSEQSDLVKKFLSAGPDAANVVLSTCLKIVKDKGEPTGSKVLALRVLDLLMTTTSDFLAVQIACHLRFLAGIAARAKEPNLVKRKESLFPQSASIAEVNGFLAAVLEFLDKWGRVFAKGEHGGKVHDFSIEREKLQAVGVQLPSPTAYRYMPPSRKKEETEPSILSLMDSSGAESQDSAAIVKSAADGPFQRTTAKAWKQKTLLMGVGCPPVERIPPMTLKEAGHASINYRKLLVGVGTFGKLYEDAAISVQFSLEDARSHTTREYRMLVTNCGNRPVQGLILRAMPVSRQFESLTSQISIQTGPKGELGPEQQVSYKGKINTHNPYEHPPKAELGYYTEDGARCSLQIKLPVPVSIFLEPANKVTLERFLVLWSDPGFDTSQVTFLCKPRKIFLEAHAGFFLEQCLTLGNSFKLIRLPAEVDDQAGAVFCAAAQYPPSWKGRDHHHPPDVLVRAELKGGRATDCAMTIKSSSYLLNRALVEVFLDVLCDPAPPRRG